MSFLREFVRNPRQTGSIAASSDAVVRMMVDSLEPSSARRIVELGAGTGAVTEGLQKRLNGGTTLIAVELNREFADRLRRRFSTSTDGRGARSGAVHVVNRSAVDLPEVLREHRMDEVDAISSGLPWTLMSMEDQSRALDAVVEVLAPDGHFVTLACLHQSVLGQGRKLRQMLRERFGQVRRQPVVWAAVPPMFAYLCSEPIKPSGQGGRTAGMTTSPGVERRL